MEDKKTVSELLGENGIRKIKRHRISYSQVNQQQ